MFDGSEHTRKMSPRQSVWYFNSHESEREDVAIQTLSCSLAWQRNSSAVIWYVAENPSAETTRIALPRKLALDGNTVMKLSELIDFAKKQERKESPSAETTRIALPPSRILIMLALAILERMSLLLDILKTKFGIDIHFQKDRNGEIRGYGIVDHNRKLALDGGDILRVCSEPSNNRIDIIPSMPDFRTSIENRSR